VPNTGTSLEEHVSRTETAPRIRLHLAAVAVAVTLGLTATACSSSSKTASPIPDPTTSPVAGTSVPPGYVPGARAPAAAVAAIHAYEKETGPPPGSRTITAVQVSAVDPSYVLFRFSPATGHENEVEGGYGFAHKQKAKWVVLGFGSDAVGCPPGAPGNQVVPAAVLTSFALTCP
jgi:hypothetical protein